jgi:cyclopropane-fatty-acyl-phospholipid synthase
MLSFPSPSQALDRQRDDRYAVVDRLLRRLSFSTVQRLEKGVMIVVDADGTHRFGRLTEDCPLEATITVLDGRFYRAIAAGGTIGSAEAYMNGWWRCSDLTALIRLLLRNRDVVDGLDSGTTRLFEPFKKAYHALNRNTRTGSRRNIAAHYDVGNDFFRLFLDETMMYSCATFEREDSTLAEASVAKLDRICRKLELGPGQRVLEIGTGWGGFALHAATHYGCEVTTTTISAKQYEAAVARVHEAGLTERVRVLREDYRDLPRVLRSPAGQDGRFHKMVSIEMIEAVGPEYYDTFFRLVGELLRPDGMMLLQSITIADQHYERAKDSVDFIQRYIFPGSVIPSITALCSSVARASDLKLFHLEDLAPHYARTLREWNQRLQLHGGEARALGYSEEFLRQWEFYFCYCEAGFAERALGDVQMLLVKPDCRRDSLLPPL